MQTKNYYLSLIGCDIENIDEIKFFTKTIGPDHNKTLYYYRKNDCFNSGIIMTRNSTSYEDYVYDTQFINCDYFTEFLASLSSEKLDIMDISTYIVEIVLKINELDNENKKILFDICKKIYKEY